MKKEREMERGTDRFDRQKGTETKREIESWMEVERETERESEWREMN